MPHNEAMKLPGFAGRATAELAPGYPLPGSAGSLSPSR
jgi:hypothetical protein